MTVRTLCFHNNISAFKAAALAILLLSAAMPRAALSAADPGPFSAIIGSWSGAGVIKKSNGTGERIRCRSAYGPAGAGLLQLQLRCASDSYNFDLSATVKSEGGAISGSWAEATRNVNGSIQGRSTGNGRQIQVLAQSVTFNANLTMTTRGDRQSIVILSPGSEVSEVAITMDKR